MLDRHWTYQVIQYPQPDGTLYNVVHEVHYEDGKVVAVSECPAQVAGNDLLWILDQMYEAVVHKPRLRHDDVKTVPNA